MCMWFSNVFEKAFISCLKRRVYMRMVKFWRSACEVLTNLIAHGPFPIFATVI